MRWHRWPVRASHLIFVLPYFLTLGIHLKRDLPDLVEGLEKEYGVSIRVAPPLDGHAALSRILADRAAEQAKCAEQSG